MDAGQNLLQHVNAKLDSHKISMLLFNKRAKELAYLEPERYFPVHLQEIRGFCSPEMLYHGFVRLTEREYNTLISILWDRNRTAFENDTGIVLGAYEQQLREEYPILRRTQPHFENYDEYREWAYKQERMEQEREQRRRSDYDIDDLPDDDI